MGTSSEHAHPVSEDNHGQTSTGTKPEDKDGSAGFVFLFFILGFIGSMIVGWVVFPQLLYSKKEQPILFNHAVHLDEVQESCQSCHYFREDGSFSGIPDLASCVECHDTVLGDSPEEERFVTEYVARNREVPWRVYSRQPDCVFFSHVAHVTMGKMECTTCHGDIGQSEVPPVYEENRISGYSRDIWGDSMAGLTRDPQKRMKMDVCSACHVAENVNQTSVQTQRGGCFVCHK
ncbi:MAG: menaquinone reductase multiheme cytochrome c subunit QrcA [Desulfobacterales bacterium]|jgi:hypothetical protein